MASGKLRNSDKISKLSILPHQIPSWRATFLNKYLDLKLPTFQPKH